MLAKMLAQWIDVNIFGWLRRLHRIAALSASAPSLPYAQPIGRAIASPPESASLDKTFQQIDRMSVLMLPILRESPDRLAQEATGQAGDSQPGNNPLAILVANLTVP